MKAFYLTASIIMTVLVLILSFENIGAQCNSLNFFFYSIEQSPTMLILGIAVIGIITGACYHAFITRILSSTPEDDEQQF